MKLSDFIRKNSDAIVAEWEGFAISCPPAWQINRVQLRNNISGLLKFIADDLDTPQTPAEQREKSKGHAPRREHETAAEEHAEQRFTIGFDTLEMISEFRALRASIIKLWRKENPSPDEIAEGLIRFNESMDQIMTESLARYIDKEQTARSLFLGTLIHDIRNPLNAISQAAEAIRVIKGNDQTHEKLALQIGRSTQRIAALVSEIIDAVRIRLGKGMPVSLAPVDLADIVGQVVSELQSAHPHKKIALDVKGDTQGSFDPGRLGQMTSNLVGNAIQHGEDATPIAVKLTGTPEEVTLAVHNTGEPIPPDILPLVFDPLRRGKTDAPSDGTSMGLGLFITREIVSAHHGHISVTSTERGTTFNVWLPKHYAEKSLH
jgi:signal transduction histidine kinase